MIDNEMVEELWEFAENCNDEHGEYVVRLCTLYQDMYIMDHTFKLEYEKEILSEYRYFKDNYKLVKKNVECIQRITVLEKI